MYKNMVYHMFIMVYNVYKNQRTSDPNHLGCSQDLLGGGESLMETLNSQTPSCLAALKTGVYVAKLGNSG
jgi:hypothetical protein